MSVVIEWGNHILTHSLCIMPKYVHTHSLCIIPKYVHTHKHISMCGKWLFFAARWCPAAKSSVEVQQWIQVRANMRLTSLHSWLVWDNSRGASAAKVVDILNLAHMLLFACGFRPSGRNSPRHRLWTIARATPNHHSRLIFPSARRHLRYPFVETAWMRQWPISSSTLTFTLLKFKNLILYLQQSLTYQKHNLLNSLPRTQLPSLGCHLQFLFAERVTITSQTRVRLLLIQRRTIKTFRKS